MLYTWVENASTDFGILMQFKFADRGSLAVRRVTTRLFQHVDFIESGQSQMFEN